MMQKPHGRTDGRTEQTEEDDSDDGTRRDGTNGQRTNDNDKTGDGAADGADDWTDRWTEKNDVDDRPTHEGYADFLQPVAPDQTRLETYKPAFLAFVDLGENDTSARCPWGGPTVGDDTDYNFLRRTIGLSTVQTGLAKTITGTPGCS